MRFSAKTQTGSGRGKTLSVPTVNVSLSDVPRQLEHGIYACRVFVGDTQYNGAMHYGPRPVFNDSISCEVHLINETIDTLPETVAIEPVQRIRNVQDFKSAEALTKQMQKDIAEIRDILGLPHDEHP